MPFRVLRRDAADAMLPGSREEHHGGEVRRIQGLTDRSKGGRPSACGVCGPTAGRATGRAIRPPPSVVTSSGRRAKDAVERNHHSPADVGRAGGVPLGRRVMICWVVAMLALASGCTRPVRPAISGAATGQPASARSPSAPAKVTPNPSNIHMVDTENGWGDFSGTILRTADGGRHWSDVGPQPKGDLLPQPGYFLDARHAWVIQYGGYSGGQWSSATDAQASVLRTTDGGGTWHAAQLPLPGPVNTEYAVQLTFLDARHGWSLAHLRTALHPEQDDEIALFSTVDGGERWNLVLGPGRGGLPAAGWKAGLTFRTPRDGWLTGKSAGGSQFLYLTHDGGRTWASTAIPLPGPVAHAAHGYTILPPTFWGADGVLPVCAVVTSYWPTIDVFRTHDGGATWTGGALVQANTGDDCVPHQRPQLGFTDAQDGYFMDDTAYAFATADGGKAWTPVHPTTPYAQVNGIDFVTTQLGWGVVWEDVGNCSGLPAVVRTTDGGMTWQVIAPPPQMRGVPHSCPPPAPPRSGGTSG